MNVEVDRRFHHWVLQVAFQNFFDFRLNSSIDGIAIENGVTVFGQDHITHVLVSIPQKHLHVAVFLHSIVERWANLLYGTVIPEEKRHFFLKRK
jgi:hypothetical protein